MYTCRIYWKIPKTVLEHAQSIFFKGSGQTKKECRIWRLHLPVSLFVCDLISVSEVMDIYSYINMRNFSKHWWIILIFGNTDP